MVGDPFEKLPASEISARKISRHGGEEHGTAGWRDNCKVAGGRAKTMTKNK
jgi:hypothetical protein